jgi:hypothetical protein
MIQYFVNYFSFSQRILLTCLFFMCITFLGAFFSTFYVTEKIDKEYRKWADSYIGPLSWGLLFLIAFTISNTWNFQATTNHNISLEATNLRLMYLYSEAFDKPIQQKIDKHIRTYINGLNKEWESLKYGKEDPDSKDNIRNFYIFLSQLKIPNDNHKLYYVQIFKYMDQVMTLRRDRIEKSQGLMPPPLLYLVFILSIVICFTLGSIRGEIKLQGIWPLLFFSFSIGLFISLILDFNYPLSGAIIPDLHIFDPVLDLKQG